MKTIFTILIITSIAFISSCDLSENDPELPPITAEGKGTFGCYVNGNLFLPAAPLGYGTGVRAELQFGSVDTVGVNIYATNSGQHKNLLISIYDSPTLQVGKVYDLSDPSFFVQYLDPRGEFSCTYREVISGSITLLKFEISNPHGKIIAGTFKLSASSSGCNDTVVITNGRFDIGDVQ